MKTNSALVLGLLSACWGLGATACGSSGHDTASPGVGGMLVTSGAPGSGGSTSSGGATGQDGTTTITMGGNGALSSGGAATGGVASGGASAGSGTDMGGSAAGGSANGGSDMGGSTLGGTAAGGSAAGGTASGGTVDTGSGGAGGTCDIASLEIFARSDTDQNWDDNDFSDVSLTQSCPTTLDVTWPHETGWENADPSEANHESTHFTVDSYYSSDLTGKQINLQIELTNDVRGAAATAGGYIVSLVSVSKFQRVVSGSGGSGSGGAGSGGASASGGTSGMGGSGGTLNTMGGTSAGGTTADGEGGSDGTVGGDSSVALDVVDTGSGGSSDSLGGSDTGGTTATTEDAYAEAELSEAQRVTLSKVGDKATLSFALPAKSGAESYDPASVIKINIRIYSAFSSSGDPSPVYDYQTSQFSITSFNVTDVTPTQ